ncbi:MAG: SDR family NAD(P)-dependent oxidoreductase [Candidatus Dormibacteria bacterium]
MKIAGAVAVVTGGAGMLGSETVRELVAQGAKAVIVDRAESPGEKLANSLGGAALFCSADVRQADDVQRAIDVASSLGPLRIVVSCAGAGIIQRTLTRDGIPHDLGQFREMIDLNLVGAFNVMRLASVAMAATEPLPPDGERGVIINVASLAGLEGSAGQIAYGAAKAGVAGMTLPGARDLAPIGVRVLAIAPGGMARRGMEFPPEDHERINALVAAVPHPRRFGTPEDFAMLVRQLVENPYLNGQVIRLDGGARLGLKA